MATFGCFCGASFATVEDLGQHVTAKGHRLMCGCGALFKSVTSILHHQNAVKHDGELGYTEHPALKNKFKVSTMSNGGTIHKCSFCHHKKPFKDHVALKSHVADKHPTCPTCKQSFHGAKDLIANEQLVGHQKAAHHCYCIEHDRAFGSIGDLTAHQRIQIHITGFQCIDCGREFKTEQGLNDHPKACTAQTKSIGNDEEHARAALVAMEEANLRCEPCKRSFKNITAFRQHKNSVKHNPLSELSCFISDKCAQMFTSRSAWLLHIESGACKSGMNRQKLYDVIYAHDTERYITHASNGHDTASIAGHAPRPLLEEERVSGLGLDFEHLTVTSGSLNGTNFTPNGSDIDTETGSVNGAMLTPYETDNESVSCSGGGIALTPSATTTTSLASLMSDIVLIPVASTQSLSEWSYITENKNLTPAPTSVGQSSVMTIKKDTEFDRWPCNICGKHFKGRKCLLQHLHSPVHTPNTFHCPPPAVLGLPEAKRLKSFKTLSGMAQHIETGACNGGIELLKTLVGITEQQIGIATGQNVKLLRDVTRRTP